MIVKKYKKSTGLIVHVQEDRYNDPSQAQLKRYNKHGRPLGDRSLYIDRHELVDTKSECDKKEELK